VHRDEVYVSLLFKMGEMTRRNPTPQKSEIEKEK
jgi:hypothetical protein